LKGAPVGRPIAQDVALNRDAIDPGTLARTEYEKPGQQHDRQLDDENDGDVASECVWDKLVGSHDAIDRVAARRALI
jgi:hypothetical protein